MNDDEAAAGLAPTPGYRYADRVGDRLHVAGQVPLDDTAALVGPGDPADQVRQCLENLRSVLEVHDFGVADVHHVTLYVVGGRANLLATWAAFREWFGGETPPATLLGIELLGHDGQLVELDVAVER